jgi:UDP-N-acetylglucosamine/UDP-N-acetyl-alpha-D-glucosaminouronate 4-epimerase
MNGFEGKAVLVTGGAGFIGSHLVDGLLERGAQVRVLDDFSTGKPANIDHCKDRIELVRGDIRDVGTCRRACEGVELVFHEAALGSVPRSMEDPASTMAVNVAGTTNVLAAARDAGIRRVVYASSSSVYGDSQKLPKREGEEGAAISPYALSKQMDEQLAAIFARLWPMTIVGLRYFNVYGPRQDPNGPYAAVVPCFFAAVARGARPVIFGDGEQRRDFTFVGDVVRANLLAATAAVEGAAVLNVGAGTLVSVNDLAGAICRAMDARLEPLHEPARAGDVRTSQADTSAAERVIGFRAEIALDEGLRRTRASFAPT